MLHKKEDRIITTGGFAKANDIKTGDFLIGPDSKPRKIISKELYNDEFFKIETLNGQVSMVGLDGRLFLVSTTTKPSEKNCYPKNTIINIKDYINKSKTFKHMFKLKSSSVDFVEQKVLIDPYFLGVLLGDGHLGESIGITTMDEEIIYEINKQAKILGLDIRKQSQKNSKASSYFMHKNSINIKNSLKNIIKELKLNNTKCGTKFIPECFLINSIKNRSEILAGLIDTDGSLCECKIFDYISKSDKLSDDVCFLSRSIGLRATKKSCIKCSQNGTAGNYYRVTISGDINIIPTRINRKRAGARLQKKNPQRFGFSILKTNENEEFVKIIVDGDGLYLGSDFIICC